MMMKLNTTHDPLLKRWITSANSATTDFPIQNLPHGVFRRSGTDEAFRGGVAIGDQILDVAAALHISVFSGEVATAAVEASKATLNGLMGMDRAAWSALRGELSRVLREGAAEADVLDACLTPQAAAEYALPARIGDYTDFFTSYDHMMNMGRLFHAESAPLPPFKSIPMGYHGRASSVEVSGAPLQRPWGQARSPGATEALFGPSQRLDYEMELGCWIGPGNARG